MSAFNPSENKGPSVLITCSIFQGFATLFAIARIVCHIQKLERRRLFAGDWLIIASIVFGWLAVAFTITSVANGDGQHMAALTTHQQSMVELWTLNGFFPGILSFTLPKLAVMSLLGRLLNPSKLHKCAMWTVAGLMLANAVVCVGLMFGRCGLNHRAVWDFDILDDEAAGCFDYWVIVKFSYWTSALAMAADIWLALYPTIVLGKLSLSRKKKIALSCALGCGWVSAGVAGYKISRLRFMASDDFSYDATYLTIWTIVEGSVVTIAACIPLLKPILDKVFGTGWLEDEDQEPEKNEHHHNSDPELGQPPKMDPYRKHKFWTTHASSIIRSIMGSDYSSRPPASRSSTRWLSASQNSTGKSTITHYTSDTTCSLETQLGYEEGSGYVRRMWTEEASESCPYHQLISETTEAQATSRTTIASGRAMGKDSSGDVCHGGIQVVRTVDVEVTETRCDVGSDVDTVGG